MIISKTPFRVSLFGGGSDYPEWFEQNGGACISTTIDKYCYIHCKNLSPFFDYNYRIVWSKTEQVQTIEEIQHPSVREGLRFLGIKNGLEIHHDGDLPARSGLGSSSAFTVGLLNCLYALKGKKVSKDQLARDAIFVERNLIKENVGLQDQVATAVGGFNRIEFGGKESFKVYPIQVSKQRLKDLNAHLMLFFTGFTRTASDIAAEQIRLVGSKEREMLKMLDLADQAEGVIADNKTPLRDLGELLHESWMIKRDLSSLITNTNIDQTYQKALKAGAWGGKILGAGGGGFMLIFAPPENQKNIRSALKDLLHVGFNLENEGSQIIVHNPQLSTPIEGDSHKDLSS